MKPPCLVSLVFSEHPADLSTTADNRAPAKGTKWRADAAEHLPQAFDDTHSKRMEAQTYCPWRQKLISVTLALKPSPGVPWLWGRQGLQMSLLVGGVLKRLGSLGTNSGTLSPLLCL